MIVKHRLLLRQVSKHLGDEGQISAELLSLLRAVEDAYVQFETDRKLVERSMDLSSRELLEANSLLRQKFERDEAVLESLRMSVRALGREGGTSPVESSDDLLDLSNLVHQQLRLRAEAEQKIREQAALLDTANDAIYVCSLDGVILYWNQGAERIYGWSSADALNRPLADLFPIEVDAPNSSERALREEGSWSGERRRITKEGRPVVVYSRMSIVRGADGRPKSVFAISTDITEKKALEAQFLRGQRMESLGALASGIAHDLNNVLAPVVLGAQLLRAAVKSEGDLRTLSDIETSARRGAEIVKQVLMFARGVEGERLALQPRHLLEEMEAITANTFPKSIRIEMEIAPDLWPVHGDVTQLHQVLMNLCINARDAMPEGGVLTLRASNVGDIGGARIPTGGAQVWIAPDSQPGPHVRLCVADTGTGISPEILEKIFEPFFTTKAVGKGTGLGLSTVLGIVRSHSGIVRVLSDPGKGSTFELYFPAAPAARVAASEKTNMDLLRGNGQAVMVVDDERAVRDIASRILEKFGYRAIPMASGHEAIQCYAREPTAIDAVITDIAMPGIDGLELVKRLRHINPDIRIMGMSGHGEGTGDESGSPWSMGLFLTKPFTVERLLLALRELLRAPG
ncbi:MAG TPA: ATP-binding protein [Opitutaceae bacterium]|nr:ATP-binding protein [Opitutaceae bacterium]